MDIPDEIPELPDDVKEAGWTRDGITYPSYKDYWSTAEEGQTYDFYANFSIEGEPHTYFFRRDTVENMVDNYEALMEDLEAAVIDMANETGEALGIIPTVKLDYVWRSLRPVEVKD